MKWALSAALLLLPSLSFEMQLSDTAVREAYFLGQRNDQKTSDFLKLYAKSFPLPGKDSGPSLRGAIVRLEFDAVPFESQTAQVEAITPDGQHITISFDLAKLR